MAKVGKDIRWHVAKLESAVTNERIAVAHIHYALRGDGQIIQKINLLVLHERKPRPGTWKLFKAKQTPEAILAELYARGFADFKHDTRIRRDVKA